MPCTQAQHRDEQARALLRVPVRARLQSNHLSQPRAEAEVRVWACPWAWFGQQGMGVGVRLGRAGTGHGVVWACAVGVRCRRMVCKACMRRHCTQQMCMPKHCIAGKRPADGPAETAAGGKGGRGRAAGALAPQVFLPRELGSMALLKGLTRAAAQAAAEGGTQPGAEEGARALFGLPAPSGDPAAAADSSVDLGREIVPATQM